MDLIDEKNGFPLKEAELILGLLDDLSHLTSGRTGGREGHKARCTTLFTGAGNNMSQGGL